MFKVMYLFKRMFCMDILTSFSCITLQQDDVWIEVFNPEVFSRFCLMDVMCKAAILNENHMLKKFFFLNSKFSWYFPSEKLLS